MVVMSSNGQPISITNANINTIATQADKQASIQLQQQIKQQPSAFLQQVNYFVKDNDQIRSKLTFYF